MGECADVWEIMGRRQMSSLYADVAEKACFCYPGHATALDCEPLPNARVPSSRRVPVRWITGGSIAHAVLYITMAGRRKIGGALTPCTISTPQPGKRVPSKGALK